MVPNALVRADAFDLLNAVEPGSAGLVYLDPPGYAPPGSRAEEAYPQYLDWLADVFEQSRRVLVKTGTLAVHADPALGGRVRVLLEEIFGMANFRWEVVVPRHALRATRALPRAHDTFMFFSRSREFTSNRLYRPLGDTELSSFMHHDSRGRFRSMDLTTRVALPHQRFEWNGRLPPEGRSWRFSEDKMRQMADEGRIWTRPNGVPALKKYLDDTQGQEIGTVWDDLAVLPTRREQSGWPGQQSQALLARIVLMSSRSGDLIIDPFCGSGTALAAAEEYQRRWIGGDASPDAVAIAARRLRSITGAVFGTGELHAQPRRTVPRSLTGVHAPRPAAGAGTGPNPAYDVFISHASEDKHPFVRSLAGALVEEGVNVWYDEFTLKLGDSLRRSIDRGLATCRFGVVVLSPAFLTKRWPQYELDGLVAGSKVLLPIWHDVDRDQVARYSPTLSDTVAHRTSEMTVEAIARSIADVIRTR
jgi:DNA modification methylase